MTSFDWDGAASLAYDYLGLCPRSRSMIPFLWASQLVGQPGQRTRDSVPGVLELRAGGRTLVLAQGNSRLAISMKFLFFMKKKKKRIRQQIFIVANFFASQKEFTLKHFQIHTSENSHYVQNGI